MPKIYGSQSQIFNGLVQDIARSQPAVWKFIDPDSSILGAVKNVSPNTETIVRIYTGPPAVDDAALHPDPEKYGRDYATLIYSRVKDPAHMDFLESENEPNDHYNNLTEFVRRMNAFLVGFCRRAKELGFKPLGPNFSTGYPEVFVPGSDFVLWPNAWQGMADGLREIKNAGGSLALHEYDAPDLFRSWSDSKQLGYLVGRHKAIYRSLPADLQDLPLRITEFEIDWLVMGVQGGFWHNRGEDAPSWMVQQMREAWTRVYSTTPQLKNIVFFISGTSSAPLFEEYDTWRTDTSRQIINDFFKENLPGGVTPPPVDTFKFTSYPLPTYFPVTQGFGENPTYYQQFGFPGHEGIDLGAPTNTVVLAVDDGLVTEVSNVGNYGLHVRINHKDSYQTLYAHLGSVNVVPNQSVKSGDKIGTSDSTGNVTGPHLHLTLRKTNATYTDPQGNVWPSNVFDPTNFLAAVTPQPPPSGVTIVTQPFVMPAAIAPFATAVPFEPVTSEYFYRLSPKAYVRNNVSAFVNIVVLDEFNAPDIGVQVVNVRPDGKGEMSVTTGAGVVQFNFGAGGAFSVPGQGPYKVFMAEGVSVPVDPPFFVSWSKILGDQVGSLGDWQGNHTEIYLQFRKIKADAIITPRTLEEAVRYPAYTVVGKGAAYNPLAALQNQARRRGLGAVLTDEFYITWQGTQYVCQGFTESILITIVGHYADGDFSTVLW